MGLIARRVLVTGASSGIGRHLAESLARLGHEVLATARRTADLAALDRIEGIEAVELDVRDAEQVERVADELADRELHGLVNNAGVGGVGPIAAWSDEDLRDVFEVNLFGPHRMTRALLPRLLASGGRIVNVGSQGGTISGPLFGPYCATKHALEAWTTALAGELEPRGVRVSIVQPGGIVSDIGRKSEAATTRRLQSAPEEFQAEAKALLDAISSEPDASDDEAPESATNRKPSPPDVVTEALLDALFSETPRLRYLVGTRWEGERVVTALLERLAEANDSPGLGLDREVLHERLDTALDALGPRSWPNDDA